VKGPGPGAEAEAVSSLFPFKYMAKYGTNELIFILFRAGEQDGQDSDASWIQGYMGR
jgi:hypothetical protein